MLPGCLEVRACEVSEGGEGKSYFCPQRSVLRTALREGVGRVRTAACPPRRVPHKPGKHKVPFPPRWCDGEPDGDLTCGPVGWETLKQELFIKNFEIEKQ